MLSFIDALFTSTSAVCITGLTVVDTATTFTTTGQVVLLLLIQIGGIGVMTFTSFIALSFFTQTSFNDQMALKNILSEESMNNISELFSTHFSRRLSWKLSEPGSCGGRSGISPPPLYRIRYFLLFSMPYRPFAMPAFNFNRQFVPSGYPGFIRLTVLDSHPDYIARDRVSHPVQLR